MDTSSSHQSENPKRLKTLASNAKFSEGNILLHQFVLDNSDPNKSGGENCINAVLLSMSDVPANIANALNEDGLSALHLKSTELKNNFLIVKKLLSCLRNIDVNAGRGEGRIGTSEDNGKTALHFAAELGRLSMIPELLNNGASIDKKSMYDRTALRLAVDSGHLDVIKLLVSKGADVNLESNLKTPLCYAARSGNLEAVEFLVSHGADVNIRDGENPFCVAAESGKLAIVEFFVKSGVDVNIKCYANRTPLHQAVASASLEIVEYLLRNGADINAQDVAECTPLHYAVYRRNNVINDFLSELYVAELHDVVRQEYFEIVKLLIDQGADLSSIDEDGKTPLHDAVYEKDFKIAEILLEKGTSRYEDHRWNPNYNAEYTGRGKIIRKLLDKGADVNVENCCGETALDLARNQSCFDILKIVKLGGPHPHVSITD